MLGLSKVFQFLLLIFRNIWFIFEHILTFRLRTVVSDWSKSASRSRNLSMSSSSTSAPVRCLKNSQVNPYHNYILFKNLADLPYKNHERIAISTWKLPPYLLAKIVVDLLELSQSVLHFLENSEMKNYECSLKEKISII